MQGGGVRTNFPDPGPGGGIDFRFWILDFQVGIDTKIKGGCPYFQK